MLDGLFKPVFDRFWNRVGRVVAKTGATPNQLTWLGVVLCAANCGAYVWHERPWLFGLLMAFTELLDDLDGAVARVTHTATRYGAYLDAATDRYKETLVLGAIGWVTGLWPLVFLCLAGSLITSYNKARAGMEIPIDNAKWPDLFERFERVALLVVGLVLTPVVPEAWLRGHSFLEATLVVLAGGSALSSLQRLRRARQLLREHDQALAEAPAGTEEP